MAKVNRNIRAFFKESLKDVVEPTTVVVPAPSAWPKNPDGSDVEFEFQVLRQTDIEKIFAKHTKKTFARDERGKFIKDNAGKPIQTETIDTNRAVRNAIAESLVWPDMHDKELQTEYGVLGHVELVEAMFSRPDIWKWLVRTYNEVQGLSSKGEDDDEALDELKN